MDTALLAGIISAVATLSGALATMIITIIKYREAKRKEKEAEKKEFYLYTAYNTVIEAERLFGEGNGAEKKKYALTKLQNEAISSGIKWDQKLASKCIEQTVALRNDYKHKVTDVELEEIIKMEIDNQITAAKAEAQAAREEADKSLIASLDNVVATTEAVKNNLEVKEETDKKAEEDTVIGVIED